MAERKLVSVSCNDCEYQFKEFTDVDELTGLQKELGKLGSPNLPGSETLALGMFAQLVPDELRCQNCKSGNVTVTIL